MDMCILLALRHGAWLSVDVYPINPSDKSIASECAVGWQLRLVYANFIISFYYEMAIYVVMQHPSF